MNELPMKYKIEFGSEDFSQSSFRVPESPILVQYVGPTEKPSGNTGQMRELYEFKILEGVLERADGSNAGNSLYMTLRVPPSDGGASGQSARVSAPDEVGRIVAVGRTVLWREP